MAFVPGVSQSFASPNYSGVLFDTVNTDTPFLTMISPRRKYTNSVEFVTGQEYSSDGGSQPSISETASLTAPTPSHLVRSQKFNVTQIFHESTGVSWKKQANMGKLSGVNNVEQTANPMNEFDFQIAAKLRKIGLDIEFTCIQGTYNRATSDTTVDKTRGMDAAITSNVIAAADAPLDIWHVVDCMKEIKSSNGDLNGLILWCDETSLLQLNADAIKNNMTIVDSSRTVNGINVSTLITPLGSIGIYLGKFIPAGTAYLFNTNVIAPVEQPHPEYGNFYVRPLAETGAGTTVQIFGMFGLDHGPEWYHGKITGINTSFLPPRS